MLDPVGRKEVLETIEHLNRDEGMTILHITHYMEEAARADRILVISDGAVYMDGTPREVFANADALHAVGLEVPQALYLVQSLEKEGYSVEDNPLTVEECVESILAILDKEGKR